MSQSESCACLKKCPPDQIENVLKLREVKSTPSHVWCAGSVVNLPLASSRMASRSSPKLSGTSELLVLNAQDIAGEPATVLKLPRAVPGGAHGSFVSASN